MISDSDTEFTPTEFTPQQIKGLLSMLQAGGYDSSSRRERIAIAAQFVSALLSSGKYDASLLRSDRVSGELIEAAVSLTDKLIVRLEKDKYFPS